MSATHIAIIAIWVVFWSYWLASAFRANKSVGTVGGRGVPLRLGTGILIALFLRLSAAHGLRESSLAIHSPALIALGFVLLASGLAFAVWARVHLGRNWGMPMSQRAEPELVTSGPYRLVRHPIYSGLLLAALGTAVAINLIGAIMLALLLPYFLYAAHIEERNMTAAFPDSYPAYRARSKRLIPFLL